MSLWNRDRKAYQLTDRELENLRIFDEMAAMHDDAGEKFVSELQERYGRTKPRLCAIEIEQKPPVTLSIPEIARRWGVTSLDAVRSVMDGMADDVMHRMFYGQLDSFPLTQVEAVERRLLMPDAVARFIDSADV